MTEKENNDDVDGCFFVYTGHVSSGVGVGGGVCCLMVSNTVLLVTDDDIAKVK